MLQELKISGLAIIDEININFNDKFHVFTGETGAGKSIIMDSLTLLMGSKGSPELIKSGYSKCVIIGVFDISKQQYIKDLLADENLPNEEFLVLERVLLKDNKSRAWINGKPVSLNTLRLITKNLIDFHGQGEQQLLLNNDHQRDLLDSFCGLEVHNLLSDINCLYQKEKIISKELMSLVEEERKTKELRNIWEYQLNELKNANIKVLEEESLKSEKNRLSHAEELGRLITIIKNLTFDNEESFSLKDLIDELEKKIKIVNSIDSSFSNWVIEISEFNQTLNDFGRFLIHYLENLEYNPQRLEEIEERLAVLDSLKRKYKKDLVGLIDYIKELEQKLNLVDDLPFCIVEKEKELKDIKNLLHKKALMLSDLRKKGARILKEKVEKELKDLNMVDTLFSIKIDQVNEIGPYGYDEVEFLLSPHKSEELKSLRYIASGGELSRIMLALKTVLKGIHETPILVFDEVDSGIGGKTAEVLGRKLKELGSHHQVFLVTHLPQLAAQADIHYLVEKVNKPDGININVKLLRGEDRVVELARMLVGEKITETTLKQSRELLGEKCI